MTTSPSRFLIFCFFCIIFTCLFVFLIFPYTHRLASCPFFLFFFRFFSLFFLFSFSFLFFFFSFFFFWNLGSRPGTPFRSFYCFLFRGNNFILPTPLVWSRNNVGVWRSFFECLHYFCNVKTVFLKKKKKKVLGVWRWL